MVETTATSQSAPKPTPKPGPKRVANQLPIWLKPLVFLVSLIPIVALTVSVFTGNAGENPIETVEHETGEWALRFLCASLLATPLMRIFKKNWPIRLRRMIGLFAFFYAFCHLLAYVWLDLWFDWNDILADIVKRPFVTVGFLAFLIMLPLAVTSNRWAVKKLARRWASLHRWVYFAAVLAVIHYVWLAKGDRIEPLVYLGVVLALLAYRMVMLLRMQGKKDNL